MKKVTVDKLELLLELEKNRTNHRAEFEEALEGYRIIELEQLEERIKEIKSGKLVHRIVNNSLPEDNTRHYDRAIAMLNMSVDLQIEIDADDFRSYVMDDWDWKTHWAVSNLAYISKSKEV